ncbi:hypothetical protein LSH36_24g09013 [Paralvinella palmiformis]|uniref:Uncharacterized protein n=1 Tax=Paralvinella palmiformis TaxID=53620 RepID=A0AAD9NHX7_9ANNE|nr:hypothetical protein LSH36_24g09013 [Paralvinella palmiformis]
MEHSDATGSDSTPMTETVFFSSGSETTAEITTPMMNTGQTDASSPETSMTATQSDVASTDSSKVGNPMTSTKNGQSTFGISGTTIEATTLERTTRPETTEQQSTTGKTAPEATSGYTDTATSEGSTEPVSDEASSRRSTMETSGTLEIGSGHPDTTILPTTESAKREISTVGGVNTRTTSEEVKSTNTELAATENTRMTNDQGSTEQGTTVLQPKMTSIDTGIDTTIGDKTEQVTIDTSSIEVISSISSISAETTYSMEGTKSVSFDISPSTSGAGAKSSPEITGTTFETLSSSVTDEGTTELFTAEGTYTEQATIITSSANPDVTPERSTQTEIYTVVDTSSEESTFKLSSTTAETSFRETSQPFKSEMSTTPSRSTEEMTAVVSRLATQTSPGGTNKMENTAITTDKSTSSEQSAATTQQKEEQSTLGISYTNLGSTQGESTEYGNTESSLTGLTTETSPTESGSTGILGTVAQTTEMESTGFSDVQRTNEIGETTVPTTNGENTEIVSDGTSLGTRTLTLTAGISSTKLKSSLMSATQVEYTVTSSVEGSIKERLTTEVSATNIVLTPEETTEIDRTSTNLDESTNEVSGMDLSATTPVANTGFPKTGSTALDTSTIEISVANIRTTPADSTKLPTESGSTGILGTVAQTTEMESTGFSDVQRTNEIGETTVPTTNGENTEIVSDGTSLGTRTLTLTAGISSTKLKSSLMSATQVEYTVTSSVEGSIKERLTTEVSATNIVLTPEETTEIDRTSTNLDESTNEVSGMDLSATTPVANTGFPKTGSTALDTSTIEISVANIRTTPADSTKLENTGIVTPEINTTESGSLAMNGETVTATFAESTRAEHTELSMAGSGTTEQSEKIRTLKLISQKIPNSSLQWKRIQTNTVRIQVKHLRLKLWNIE